MMKSVSWGWVLLGLVLTIPFMAVMIITDGSLAALGMPGVASLQGAAAGDAMAATVEAWRGAGADVLARVGFSIGWDYLFIVINGVAYTLAGLKAREELFPMPGALRTIALILVVLMPVGSALDAIENVFQLQLVAAGPDAATMQWAATATMTKWIVMASGMLLVVAGLVMAGVRKVRGRPAAA